MDFKALHPAEQVRMIIDRIYKNGQTTMSGGNLSVMDDEDNIWITPSGIDKGMLKSEDIVQVKPNGEIVGKHKPSMELPFHSMVYKARPDVKAVVHAHPPALVSYSLTRTAPLMNVLREPNVVIGKIGIAKYEIPGSMRLAETIAEQFKQNCNVVLMENHGAVTCGKDIFEAFKRFEAFEFLGELGIQSNRIGVPIELTAEQLNANPKKDLIKSETSLIEATKEEKESRELLARLVQRSCNKRLFTSSQGSFSIRLNDDSFIITPRNVDRLYLEPNDLVAVHKGAYNKNEHPSCYTWLHRQIYLAHPSINAIAIAQPVNAMAFAVTHKDLDARTIPESYIMMRNTKKFSFDAFYGNFDAVIKHLSDSTPVLLIENECLIVSAESALNCFDKLEVSDFTAKTLISTSNIGTPYEISKEEIKEIDIAFNL